MNHRYPIVIEVAGNNFSAYSPDVPGCVATGRTIDEVRREMRAAIAFHLSGLRLEGQPIPVPTSTVDYVEVTADAPVA